MSRNRRSPVYFTIVLILMVICLSAWGGDRYIRRQLLLSPPPAPAPFCDLTSGRPVVTLAGRLLVAEVGRFQDEFFAYLVFDYLRKRPQLKPAEVLLTVERTGQQLAYPVLVHLNNNDLVQGVTFLAALRTEGLIRDFEWRYLNSGSLMNCRRQTSVFITAYNLPSRPGLPTLTRSELVAYTHRFLRLKSMTDTRVRRGLDPEIRPLTPEEAKQLASDIVDVSEFYSLPIEFFLGIGAMENNYMNVKGDLGHAVWKRSAEKGDIVLKRRRRRVLVLNESSGVWQITRETLRVAHRLYLKDTRDYSLLPSHLRPPKELRLDDVDPRALTTYAGLLFRDLLDHFKGDVPKAVGAYNGGPGNPNPIYEEGVTYVAVYARHIFEQAAGLQGRSVTEMSFLLPQ